MSGASNVVEVVVKASNQTGAGFDEAKAGADSTAASMDELAAATDRATQARIDAAMAATEQSAEEAKLAELEQSGTATTDELAAAQDRLAAARQRSIDADAELAAADARVTEAQALQGDTAEESAAKTDTAGGLMADAGGKIKMAMLGVAVGMGLAVKSAADFQQTTTRLVTSAGESAKNLAMVQAGILGLSGTTNTSISQLTSGMYQIESAGFHGASGLTVLKAAAEGAAMEGASLGTVSNALTTVLNAYGLKASDATAVTNQMQAAVGQGKMTLEDFAGSLSHVLPVAAANKISFSQVAGAIATMTSQGMSAQQAADDLNNTINSLTGASATSAQEMRALGLNANQVATSIGKVGLTGTMQELSEAILKNTSGGNVMLGYMKEMTPQAQGLAREILAGKISTEGLRTAVYGLNPEQAKLVSLFDTSATSATGLKQTYSQAMKEMTGGETGLNVALMLGGTHAKTFADNVNAVSGAAKHAGSDVSGWGAYQKEANTQFGEAVKSLEAMGTTLGMALLPAVTAIIKPITSLFEMISKNKVAAIAFATVVGGVLAGAVGVKAVNALKDMKNAMKAVADGVEAVVKKIASMVGANDAQAASSKKAADAAKTASKEEAAASEEAAGAAETAAAEQETDAAEVAAANEEAAAESSSSWLASIGEQLASAAGWVAENVAKIAVVVGTSIAGALSTAGAWIAANAVMTAGIALVVAAVVVAVVEIVKHWKSIVHGVEEAWDDVRHAVASAVDAVVGFVKSHWELLLAILLGPIAVAVLEIAKHWDTIRKDAEKFFDDVRHDLAAFGDDVVRGFERMFDTVVDTAARWYDGLVNWVRRTFDDFIRTEVSGLDNIIHWFEGLPGRVMGAIAALPGQLYSAGRNIIHMLAHGISDAVGDVTGAISHIAGEITSHLPFSPAKKGPLSGSGDPALSGLKIPRMVAQGILAGTPDVQAAAAHMAGAALGPHGGYGAYAAGGGGQLDITLHIDPHGKIPEAFAEMIRVEVRDKGGGGKYSVQKTYGRTWPTG